MCMEYPVIITYTYLIRNDAKISVCLTFAGFLFHNEASDSSCLQTTCDIGFCKLQQLPMLKGQPFLLLLCTFVILPSSLPPCFSLPSPASSQNYSILLPYGINCFSSHIEARSSGVSVLPFHLFAAEFHHF